MPSGKTVKSTVLDLRGAGVGVPLEMEEEVSVRAGAMMRCAPLKVAKVVVWKFRKLGRVTQYEETMLKNRIEALAL